MSPGVRKLVLATHLTVSVGWIGAVAAYLAFDVTVVLGDEEQTLRTAYLAMERIAGNVIVPFALASLGTGVGISVGTRWGLFRHYWVVISLLLTLAAVAILLVETRTIGVLADLAADPTTSGEELRALPSTLVHSVGGTLVLLVILVLNVYKPRGMTRYGQRREGDRSSPADDSLTRATRPSGSA